MENTKKIISTNKHNPTRRNNKPSIEWPRFMDSYQHSKIILMIICGPGHNKTRAITSAISPILYDHILIYRRSDRNIIKPNKIYTKKMNFSLIIIYLINQSIKRCDFTINQYDVISTTHIYLYTRTTNSIMGCTTNIYVPLKPTTSQVICSYTKKTTYLLQPSTSKRFSIKQNINTHYNMDTPMYAPSSPKRKNESTEDANMSSISNEPITKRTRSSTGNSTPSVTKVPSKPTSNETLVSKKKNPKSIQPPSNTTSPKKPTSSNPQEALNPPMQQLSLTQDALGSPQQLPTSKSTPQQSTTSSPASQQAVTDVQPTVMSIEDAEMTGEDINQKQNESIGAEDGILDISRRFTALITLELIDIPTATPIPIIIHYLKKISPDDDFIEESAQKIGRSMLPSWENAHDPQILIDKWNTLKIQSCGILQPYTGTNDPNIPTPKPRRTFIKKDKNWNARITIRITNMQGEPPLAETAPQELEEYFTNTLTNNGVALDKYKLVVYNYKNETDQTKKWGGYAGIYLQDINDIPKILKLSFEGVSLNVKKGSTDKEFSRDIFYGFILPSFTDPYGDPDGDTTTWRLTARYVTLKTKNFDHNTRISSSGLLNFFNKKQIPLSTPYSHYNFSHSQYVAPTLKTKTLVNASTKLRSSSKPSSFQTLWNLIRRIPVTSRSRSKSLNQRKANTNDSIIIQSTANRRLPTSTKLFSLNTIHYAFMYRDFIDWLFSYFFHLTSHIT